MNNFYSEIKKIQLEDCPYALSFVIERYTPVFLSMYSKFFFSVRECGADPSDILADKDLIIYESAKSFNLDKGASFCTWLSNNTKYTRSDIAIFGVKTTFNNIQFLNRTKIYHSDHWSILSSVS